MAINAGTVYYTVDADTQKAIDSAAEMNKSLESMQTTMAKTDQQVKQYSKTLNEAGNSISKAGVVLDQFGNVNTEATTKMQKLMATTDALDQHYVKLSKTAVGVRSGISGIGRSAGQAGIQIQQFIGQIQGGQSAMLALSQQSADLGFVLGAPLLGAVVGIGASLAGMLLPKLFESSNAVEELTNKIKELVKASTLTEAQAKYLVDQTDDEAEANRKLAAETEERIQKTQAITQAYKNLSEQQKNGVELSDTQISFLKLQAPLQDELAKKITAEKASLDTLNQEYKGIMKQRERYALATEKSLQQQDEQVDSSKKTEQALKLLESRLKVQVGTLGMTERGIAHYRANLLGASKDIHDQIDVIYDYNDALKAQEKARKELEAKTKTGRSFAQGVIDSSQSEIESYSNQLKKLEDLRDSDLKNAQLYTEAIAALNKKQGNISDYIKGDTQPLSGGEFDNQESRYQEEIKREEKRYADQMTRLQEAKNAKVQVENGYNSLEVEMAQEHQNRLTQIEEAASEARLKSQRATAQAQMNLYSQVFGSMSTMTSNMMSVMDEQSSEYKTMFAIQKAFAVAQAIVSAELAAAQVLAHDASFMGMGAIATSNMVRSMGYASAGVIAGTAIAGGRLYGGDVQANGMYRINEDGKPEVFNAANGQQYMLPNTRGEVVSNKDASGGGNVTNYITVNADGSVSGDGDKQAGKLGRTLQQAVKQGINQEMRPGGAIWQYLQKGKK